MMGIFYLSCTVENQRYPKRKATVPNMLVDSGSECTWIPAETLKRIGIVPMKKNVTFQMANGQEITRSIGFAIVRVGEFFTTDEVVFAQSGDLHLIGARTLEGMNVRVDSVQKKLVAAGPILAAVRIRKSR